MPQNIQELITFLKTNGFRAECPHCSGKMDLSKTPLFDAENFTSYAKELKSIMQIFQKTLNCLMLKRNIENFIMIKLRVENDGGC
jgi:hypothetical protein